MSTQLRFRSSPVRSFSERQALFSGIAPVYDNVRAKMGDSVLDCGSGDIAFLLSEKIESNRKVTGLDFSKEQLSVATSMTFEF